MVLVRCSLNLLPLLLMYIVRTACERNTVSQEDSPVARIQNIPFLNKPVNIWSVQGLQKFMTSVPPESGADKQSTHLRNVQLNNNQNRNDNQQANVNIDVAVVTTHRSKVSVDTTTVTVKSSMVQQLSSPAHQKGSNYEYLVNRNSIQQKLNIFTGEDFLASQVDQNVKLANFSGEIGADDEETEHRHCTLRDNGTFADCSFLNLTFVPSDGIPNSIWYFDLHNNSIYSLEKNTFKNYTQLRSLDLSNNIICVIENTAFSGLHFLRTLNLWNNNLNLSDSTFPEDIFIDLFNLNELKINRNTDCKKNCTGMNYPDKALSHLTHLKSLHIDGLSNQDFGVGFKKMRNLVNLTVAGYQNGYCLMNSLSKLTFKYLSNLQHLDIRNCYIRGPHIDREAFSPLRNLISLNISHNEDIDIENVDKVFNGLRKIRSLRILSMSLVVNRYSIGMCLDSSFIRKFPQSLEHFEAQENSIEVLDRNVVKLLSPSLKTLDVSGNRFIFGTYLQDLTFMKNLTKLKLNGGGFIYNLPDRYPFRLTRNKESNCTPYDENVEEDNQPFILTLPPKLRTVEMNRAGLTYKLSELVVNPNNTLVTLSMNKNNFPQLHGPFIGLHMLEHLDLSSSYVRQISDHFFTNLVSLKRLNLAFNLLGDFFSSHPNAQVFSPLINLTMLDLSFNDIHSFSPNVFAGLNNLKILLLHKNALSQFDVDISHMTSLILLNLTNNRIQSLNENIRTHIGHVINTGRNVSIDLSLCPILCLCENLDFLVWMKQSSAFNHTFTDYVCTFNDNLFKNITDGYNSTILELQRKCPSKRLLFFLVAAVMCVIVCIIFCTVLYRLRWEIRYMYYAARLFYKPKIKPKSDFKYDAFISYDNKDGNFVENLLLIEMEKRGLKLCIHGRDFLTGDHIASNILRSVFTSKKTLVVLTGNLVSSYWCSYEIQMANMEAVYTGRQVLLFLIKEELPECVMGKELLFHIRKNTYITYPDPLPDDRSLGRLWDKLASDIRD